MARPEDELLLDDFLFQETDAFALPLLDFDPDGALLTPSELAMSQTHLQQTQLLPFPAMDSDVDHSRSNSQQPPSPVSTDGGNTDAEVSTPPPAFVQQQPAVCSSEMDAASSPAARMPLLSSSMTAHSPLPSDQKLLMSTCRTSSSNNHSNSQSTNTTASSTTARPTQLSKMLPTPAPTAFPGALPYAMPVAYFPPVLNANQKRPLPQVLPGASSPSSCVATTDVSASPAAATSTDNDPNAKKSKREIRQMKNRESANKSRLRRKAQLSTLTTEVSELKKKEQELQTIIAGLRAENKSLLDQNTFLRSLVTSFKQEPSSSSSSHQMTAAFASLPPPVEQSCVALNMLESGQKMEVDDEPQTAEVDLAMARPGKRRAVTSTLSTASLAVCASVFGITIFADYDGGAVDSGNIRSVGRVLHEAQTACGMERCSSEASTSVVGFLVTAVRSWWQFVSSSELVFGVLLNVLSFVAIVVLYQLWQSHSEGEWSWKCPMSLKSERLDARRYAQLLSPSSTSRDEKKRIGNGLDVRLREKVVHARSTY
ncbi:hypothetical protein P3T76_002462 [Phytophthora citrophthora]|uniref:BZIP domain-containing protein n=1 Tax=Phytophthora citrophthora TaxID=4793 RepID=A0AAD9LST1_9STRA|nr:hypothetical protein P3T76_002462 [Phytophthora citrophthora]